MKKRFKKPLTLNEAADQLATIIEKHLDKLPASERKRRLNKGHDRILRAVARKKTRNLPLSSSKSSKQLDTAANRLVARSQ
jgi:hypothetical protein